MHRIMRQEFEWKGAKVRSNENPFSLFSLQKSIAEFYVSLKLTKPIAIPPLLYLHL